MKKIVLALLVLALLAGGALLLARYERYEWSTQSAEAIAAFEAGQEAAGKLYSQDAARHFERALAADPDFAAAQLYLMLALNRSGGDPQRLKELLEALEQQDLDQLNPRERALISIFLARAHGEREKADHILDEYLAEHPDDPYLLDLHCMQLVTAGPSREPDAESCLRRLIELDPNRVQAQNLLAYGAMNRGDFARAEEQFEIYRFLAPDQANPHDSLGELLMVTGRYDEAKQEFHKALALKPDFCPPWQNMVTIELLRRNAGAAREVVDEARDAGGCPQPVLDRLVCQVPLWPMANEGRWQEIWDSVWSCGGGEKAAEAEAGEEAGDGVSEELAGDDETSVEPPPEDRVIFAVMAALHTGRLDDARRIAEQVAARAEPDAGDMYSMRSALVEHLAGLVAAGNGDMEVAVDHLRAADDRTVWGGGTGIFKLFNRLQLAGMEAEAGDAAAAQRTMDELAAVNRPFASRPPLPPLYAVPAPHAPASAAEPRPLEAPSAPAAPAQPDPVPATTPATSAPGGAA